MENGKRKIMWCLTILVVAAVAIGVIYYVKTNMSPAQQTKGYPEGGGDIPWLLIRIRCM